MVQHGSGPRIFLSLVIILFASGCATYEYIKHELGIRDRMIAQEAETRQQQVDGINTRLGEVGQERQRPTKKRMRPWPESSTSRTRCLTIRRM